MRLALFVLSTYFLSFSNLLAQKLERFIILDSIEVVNGSFEVGLSKSSNLPSNWFDCGDSSETAPSVFVEGSPFLMKDEVAQNGNIFLSLVTRENSTWEAIAQPLKEPLEAGENYVIKLYLRRSYIVDQKDPARDTMFNSAPIVLSIHSIKEIKELGIDRNNIVEKLATSDLIIEKEWTEHTFVFKPRKEVSIIMLEAFYEVPVLVPYNGHLFLDNISDIYQVE